MRLRTKILLAILLALGYWVFVQHVANKEGGEGRVSQARLREWYANDNKDYFDDKLPHDTEIIWQDLRYRSAMGDTICNELGCLIRIDSYTNVAPVTAHETELHEMCHVATQGEVFEHGPAFQNCMTMLFKKGALDGLI